MSTTTNFGMETKKVQDRIATGTDKAKESASSFGSDVKSTLATAGDKAREAGSALVDQAKDIASSVAETAGNVANAVGHRAQDAASAVGGMIGKAGSAVATGVETGGRFLKDEGLSVADDLSRLIRRNPISAVLIGIALGYVTARALHRT